LLCIIIFFLNILVIVMYYLVSLATSLLNLLLMISVSRPGSAESRSAWQEPYNEDQGNVNTVSGGLYGMY